MAISPPTWVVIIGDPSFSFVDNTGSPTGNQQTVNGTLQDIDWTIGNISISSRSHTANISYERSTQKEPPKAQRHAPVQIKLNGEVVFSGFVQTQTITHSSVRLNCEGVINLYDRVPIFGALRNYIDGTIDGYTQESLSIFNEKGERDMIAVTNTQFILDNNDPGSFTLDKWTRKEIALYVLGNLFPVNVSPITQGHLDISSIISEIASELDSDDQAQSDLRLSQGIITEINELAEEQGKMMIWDAQVEIPAPMSVTASAIRKYDAGRKRTVTYNASAKSSDESTLDSATYDIQITHDFTSPTRLLLVSGRKYISTLLFIDPSSGVYRTPATLTSLETQVNDDRAELRFTFDPTGANGQNVLESADGSYTFRDLFKSAKSNTINSINPRFKTKPTGGIIDFDQHEVYVDFKTDKVPNLTQGTEIKIGGDQWEALKKSKAIRFMDLIERLNYHLEQDKIGFNIRGFSKEGSPANFKKQFDEVILNVHRFIVPITIEIDNRLVIQAERSDDNEDIIIETKIVDNNSPISELDMLEHEDIVVIREDLRPVEYVKGFDFYSPGAGITTDDGLINTDLVDLMKAIASQELHRVIIGDSTSVSISIPIELYPKLTDAFPKKIGDWINLIGDAESGGDIAFAGYRLQRPVMLEQIDYGNTDITLNFS